MKYQVISPSDNLDNHIAKCQWLNSHGLRWAIDWRVQGELRRDTWCFAAAEDAVMFTLTWKTNETNIENI